MCPLLPAHALDIKEVLNWDSVGMDSVTSLHYSIGERGEWGGGA